MQTRVPTDLNARPSGRTIDGRFEPLSVIPLRAPVGAIGPDAAHNDRRAGRARAACAGSVEPPAWIGGMIVCLMGPSAAGKSTLAKLQPAGSQSDLQVA